MMEDRGGLSTYCVCVRGWVYQTDTRKNIYTIELDLIRIYCPIFSVVLYM